MEGRRWQAKAEAGVWQAEAEGAGVWQAEAGAGVWQAEAGAGCGRPKQGQGYGRPMQEGQGNGTAEENTEKVKFVDEYGLWLGANSAIVHIVRSGIT